VRTVASETPEPSIAYRLHANELIATLRTDERQGLGDEEARARLARHGPNELAAHKACEGLVLAVTSSKMFDEERAHTLLHLLRHLDPRRVGS
jgi:magnesium-transporting ATPase (P-type)